MATGGPEVLDVPTTAEEFIRWASTVVENEAYATERAIADDPHMAGTAADYLADLRTLLERLATGDVDRVVYPLEQPAP